MRYPEYETLHEQGFVRERFNAAVGYALTFVFDPTGFEPSDPGSTTPMMVHVHDEVTGKSWHATGGCAASMGEVDDFQLSDADLKWLDGCMDRAEKLMIRLGY